MGTLKEFLLTPLRAHEASEQNIQDRLHRYVGVLHVPDIELRIPRAPRAPREPFKVITPAKQAATLEHAISPTSAAETPVADIPIVIPNDVSVNSPEPKIA